MTVIIISKMTAIGRLNGFIDVWVFGWKKKTEWTSKSYISTTVISEARRIDKLFVLYLTRPLTFIALKCKGSIFSYILQFTISVICTYSQTIRELIKSFSCPQTWEIDLTSFHARKNRRITSSLTYETSKRITSGGEFRLISFPDFHRSR